MQENKSHVKYVSLKHSSKAERIAGLKLNQIINAKLRYEYFKELGFLAEAEYNNQKMTIAQVLMKAKINGKTLFNGVEQGRGKYSARGHMFCKEGLKSEVHQ